MTTEEAAQMARNCAQMVKELLAAKDEELKRLREAAKKVHAAWWSGSYEALSLAAADIRKVLQPKEPNNES